jgi:hypothetical protein
VPKKEAGAILDFKTAFALPEDLLRINPAKHSYGKDFNDTRLQIVHK